MANGRNSADNQEPWPPFYHGTKADLKAGDLIGCGFQSNYGKRKQAAFVYFTGTLDAAIWVPSWPQGTVPAGSTRLSRPAPSRTILI